MVRNLLATLAATVCAIPTLAAPPAPESAKGPTVARISGPFAHANLTVFLLHGDSTLPNRPFLTLQEALDQKKIVVHETSTVHQLAVENVSADCEVFLMTGDIVKGGKQDRAIAFDMVLPPKSGQVPIGSFCVESGRWQQRGAESAGRFAGSDNQVVGKDLKNAINRDNDQQRVWQEVAKAQQKLASNVGMPVAAAESPSSLQLALENRKLKEKLEAYEKALSSAAEKKDVIGVVFAVNGEFSGAELYGSSSLFARLWPKLLKAAATEALADLDDRKKFGAPTVKGAEAFLAEATAEPAREVQVAANNANPAATANRTPAQAAGGARQTETTASPSHVRIVRYDGKKVMAVECQDKAQPGAVIHRSYIAK